MARLIFVFSLAIGIFAASNQPVVPMSAHFIDVGQAHATLLAFPCGVMLIDAGAQDDASVDDLVSYLDNFFEANPEYNRTLDSILITHNHIDHTRALRRVVETFTVKRYIDNGWTTGSGRAGPNWLRARVQDGTRDVRVLDVQDSQVEAAGRTGLTNRDIDPFPCEGQDPSIKILQGSFRDSNPGWPDGEYDNQNNHSLIARVEYGTLSFLFMGDLEVAGIELLLDYYDSTAAGRRLLDIDVLQVGHHGSYNATTHELINATTPAIAVIPVGSWRFGQGPGGNRFSTNGYGHPRKYVVDLLQEHIGRRRSAPISAFLGLRARKFQQGSITKAVYATGWDGTVTITGRGDEDVRVRTSH
jgi:competence protein ComEC